MSSITPIRQEKTQSDPRAKLRYLDKVLADKRAALQTNEVGIERAAEHTEKCEAAHERAAELIERAKTKDADRLKRAITQGHAPPAGTTRAARLDLEAAADELANAQAARAQMQEARLTLQAEIEKIEIQIDAEMNVLMLSLAERELQEHEEMRARFAGNQARLEFFRNRCSIPHGMNTRRVIPELAAPFASISSRINAALDLGIFFDVTAAQQHPGYRQLEELCARLRVDPDAPIDDGV